MLRILMLDLRTMNEDRFTQALQDYFSTHRGGRGSTADFQRVIERHLGIPMDWFFREWLDRTELPTYKVAWKTEPRGDGTWRTLLRVDQSGVGDDFQMYVPVTLDLGGGRVARMRVLVKGPHTETELAPMPAEPKKLVFNDLHGVLANVKMTGW
jgi:aminopeptidase N